MSVTVVRNALLIAALALAAMRGLVAPGLMIVADPHAGVRVTLCSAHGSDEVFVLDKNGALIPESELPPGDAVEDICPFAGATAAAEPAFPFILTAPFAFAEKTRAFHPVPARVGQGLAAPPPPALAPPFPDDVT